jgi:eukaryotic-like serine/threonine-protein kinase
MVCAQCGADIAASQRVCHRCGHSTAESAGAGAAMAVTAFTPAPDALTALTPAPDALTPLPTGSPDESLTIAPASSASPAEPDTHARPAIITGPPQADGAAATPPQGSATRLFQTGTPFGRRYHLIRQLGVGGMGAVYQAWDEELSVVVAIKVIRPEAMADPAAARDLERRFKRELLLARNVTHKNVVRIHDLGEIDGVKYITMPYVNGSDLASVLKREGRLPVPRALSIARQVASGLVAAHDAGVVHRDLKPANILLDEEDHALITDFGIARSVTGPGGGTVVGTVVGTLDYMAPEQARAEAADHRADIYAFGWMLSDMLVGRRPVGNGESAIADLIQRISNPAPSVRSLDPTIPQALDDIIMHCVQPDPALRYQRTQELLIDLEAAAGAGAPSTSFTATRPQITHVPAIQPQATTITISLPNLLSNKKSRNWTAAGVLVLVAAGGGFAVYRVLAGSSTAAPSTSISVPVGQAVSLAILPFRNASGDSSLDYLGATVSETLGTTIGQSSALKTVPGSRVSQILGDLRIARNATLDPSTLGRLAELCGADTVMWGQYIKFGNEIRIDATLQDVRHQRAIPLKGVAATEQDLLGTIERLAGSVRENLALSDTAVKELAASSFKPSTMSVNALRYYNEGLDLARQYKHLEALKKFGASTQEDPRFALAYSELAQSYAGLGQMPEAEKASRTAVALSDALPESEKYLIAGNHARILNDNEKALEIFENLAKRLHNHDQLLFALAATYETAGAFDKARANLATLLERDPKNMKALIATARVEIMAGNAKGGLDYLNRALTLSIQLENEPARATILRGLGVGYSTLGKLDEGLRYYQESLELERKLDNKPGMADCFHGIAQIQGDSGKFDLALKSYQEALQLRRAIGEKQGTANVLLDMGRLYAGRGDYDRALSLYGESLQLQRQLGNRDYEAAALNNIGDVYFARDQYDLAQTHFARALTLQEKIKSPGLADTVHNVAETSLKLGEYDTALKGYLRALELRRGIDDSRGIAIEQDSVGAVAEYQGRYAAALDARKEALEIFRKTGERSVWLPMLLASYGSALNQIGRGEQAEPVLQEGLKVTRELGNEAQAARLLTYRADRVFYTGEFGGAAALYQEALSTASRAKAREFALWAQAGLAKTQVLGGRPDAALRALRQVRTDAERLGLPFLALECSVYVGAAQGHARQYADARRELENALSQAEKLGARMLMAQAHHFLAAVSRDSGSEAEGRQHAEEARRVLEAIRRDAHDDLLKRADVKMLLADSTR